MGKLVDTDDVMKTVDAMFSICAAKGMAPMTEDQIRNVRGAYEMILDLTSPANAAEMRKREGEYTSFVLVGNLGERIAVFSCAKCGEKITHITGTGEYKFCPFCGREKKE